MKEMNLNSSTIVRLRNSIGKPLGYIVEIKGDVVIVAVSGTCLKEYKITDIELAR